MDKGFVIIAQDGMMATYLTCAEALAKSIKRVMPDAKISLISSNNTYDFDNLYDKIIPLPSGDLSGFSNYPQDKQINDWQVYEASPYEYTIKLEADMFIPKSIDHWWEFLKERDVVVCSTIRNFKQEISDIKAYRRFIIDNNLPDVYNGITYFKKSPTAERFFSIVREVFENWSTYKSILKCNDDEPATTDWVYAIACLIMGVENTTLPQQPGMSMVHMKQFINGLPSENWTDTLVTEILPHAFRINTITQEYPVHYYMKSFANHMLDTFRYE